MSAVEKNQSNFKVVTIGNDAEFINSQIELGNQAFGKSLDHYRNAGERLAKVRDDFKGKKGLKGQGFMSWVENNCNFERRHAYRYISVWENWAELVSCMSQAGDVFSLTDALKAIKDIKSIVLQARDDTYDTAATEVVDGIESNANKRVLEAHKQTETERKAREKAEKELAKLNKQELALKATQDENKQLLSLVEGLQTQITTMQKPEVRTVTVIDDLATKELEKVKAELAEKERQLSNITTGKSKTIVKEIVPEDYEELKKKARHFDEQREQQLKSATNNTLSAKHAAREIYRLIFNQTTISTSTYSDLDKKIFLQVLELIKPLI